MEEKIMLNVYLSGEIHSDWRQEIIDLCKAENLDINFTSPVTNHEASDNCGVEILGNEANNYWIDTKGAGNKRQLSPSLLLSTKAFQIHERRPLGVIQRPQK